MKTTLMVAMAIVLPLAMTAASAQAQQVGGWNEGLSGGAAGMNPGRSGHGRPDAGWTWNANDWLSGERRDRIRAREIWADEIDRANRLGHGQGGPSGADHGGTHGLGRDRSSVN